MEIWVMFLWLWLLSKPVEVAPPATAYRPDQVYVYNHDTWPISSSSSHLPADTTKTCQQCHDDLLTGESIHGPVKKGCDRCHQPIQNEHPQENQLTFVLTNQVPGLCYECHDPNDKEHVHDPVQKGDCFTCHDVHNSPNLYLVKKDPVGPLCLDCHELDIPANNQIHKAVSDGNCTGCHNPHQSNYNNLMASNKPYRMCRKCHRSVRKELKRPVVHTPFDKKQCFDCHNGHSSQEAHLADSPPADLCLSCHEDMHNTLTNARLVHKVIQQDEACLKCHSAHATDYEHVLRKDKKDKQLCLDCHDKKVAALKGDLAAIGPLLAPGNTIHEPINTDGCTACHQPHQSEEHSLLNLTFPTSNYASGIPGNYDLCFKCHPKEMLTAPLTDSLTGFRQQRKNLHYLHSQGKRGRNCKLCHDAHGTPNKYLIKNETLYGNWLMPIEFTSDSLGGSCLTGCHERKFYERQAKPDTLNLQHDTGN